MSLFQLSHQATKLKAAGTFDRRFQMTDDNPEKNRLEAEIQMLQDEIDRRHERINAGVDVASNSEKIDALRERRTELKRMLADLA